MRRLAALAAAAWVAAAGAADFKPWDGGATPPLELQDLQGQVRRLGDFRGKVVLVHFWATWCGPCREELPSIEKLRAGMAGRAFEVLAVDVDEPGSRVRGFLEEMPLALPTLLDTGAHAARAWGVRIVPASYLVGTDGRIRYVHQGMLDWDEPAARARIDELLR
ncbi:MAG TPA: TlpA disulfide reductase family protein [Burkholderiales bacterium]|nr:TlpA disulfide reductase family protein [Burkholderiales bacterium]